LKQKKPNEIVAAARDLTSGVIKGQFDLILIELAAFETTHDSV
jgi:hypothetical protein